MRNIFELTRAEQRVVIFIVVVLVAAAFAQHFLETRLRPASTKSKSTPTPSPIVHPSDEQNDVDDSD
ncbi:MAG TPA: hypothetical protein VJ281_01480 [Chthoniobacterales bacterium]|jgi:hypothetical protein|nr:hypothetical protein [Chthoniobacterales bacterium]